MQLLVAFYMERLIVAAITIWSVLVQFTSVQDGIYALGKAHMRSTPSLRGFPNVAFETVPMFVWLTMALSRPFKEDRLALPLSHLSSPGDQWCDILGFVPTGISQASQHFRSSEKQATCEGCFPSQSVCSVISLHSSMSRAVYPLRSFWGWMSTIDTFQSGLPIPLFVFWQEIHIKTC